MKIKPLILASALALSGFTATASYAANFVVDLGSPSSVGGYSADIGNTILKAGAFTDIFDFTPSVSGLAAGSLIKIGFNSHDILTFTSATLNGTPFTFNSSSVNGLTYSFGVTPFLTPINGFIRVIVNGIAAPSLAAGSDISASYGGNISVGAVSAVPEPETYAMMLAGLGLVGFMARRRKKAESKETLPQLSAC